MALIIFVLTRTYFYTMRGSVTNNFIFIGYTSRVFLRLKAICFQMPYVGTSIPDLVVFLCLFMDLGIIIIIIILPACFFSMQQNI